jgi:drug/metabolite transporter (DMT)-like permease
LLTGVLIAIYTSIDAAAVRASGESFRYSVVLFTLTSLFITPLVMLRRRRGEVASLLRAEWMRLLVAGAASLGAYSLVLVAARQAPVGAVAAVREISVLFGALGGWWALKEKLAVRGLAGAVVIVAGVVGLALL